MLLTTQRMLSKFVNDEKDKLEQLDLHCIVDEVDRLSESKTNTLGFFGAKGIM